MPASNQPILLADNIRLSYQIIGGKSGAPVETLLMDCMKRQSTLSRQTQEAVTLSTHSGLLSLAQCQQLAQLASPLCQSGKGQQPNVFDGASYRLSCAGSSPPEVVFSWQGTLKKAPNALRPWHNYTRQLVKTSFPNVTAYP